ncbi:MAG: hypothetical protein IH593_09385, partial [Bacteroidales bacterium]|nr:hypothetical protein [Bacteroidales bacterium]
SNSLFSGNSCTSATLKGGTITSLASSPAIVNSTIVNSSSPVADGVSIYLENSAAAKVVNTVIWGGSNLIGLNSTPATVFAACALQGVSYTGNITLSSSNTAVDGPNFVNPAGGDFSIAFVSPLRDSGVDTYTGVTIPTTDINSRSRIFLSDIGAYEIVYSRWRGGTSTAWTFPKNWEGSVIPGTTNIVIPGGLVNYPTVSPGPSFTLNAGLQMIMNPGSRVTFTSLTNNGTIDIQSDATAMASLITNSYSGTGGSLKLAVTVTGGDIAPDVGRWHYIAAPMTVSKSVITDIDPYNLINYDESKVTTDVAHGWQWHDGWDGTTGFNTLEAKRGYNIAFVMDTTIIYN